MTNSLVFLHTSPVHVTTFSNLLAELAPEQPVTHLVREDLLDCARRDGLTDVVVADVQSVVHQAQRDGAQVVLCTCSTIGNACEVVGGLRVDRPMMEKAVALGKKIIIAVTLQSTIEPTRALVLDVAAKAGKQVELIETIVEGAFARFEAGDLDGYANSIARHLEAVAPQGDVIIIAQASMVGAAALCQGITIPILSSPQLGLQAALDALS
ncbi:MAG: hypothetical protein ACPG8W_06790 [Candidatus Promineifilaceae bacterium]